MADSDRDSNVAKSPSLGWGWLFGVVLFVLVGAMLVMGAEIMRSYGAWLPAVAAVQALGIGILTSSILGGFAELALRKQMLGDFSDRTSALLNSFFDKTFRSSIKYGFVGIADTFDAQAFFDEATPGDEVLWLDTYDPGHHAFLETVREKAILGVSFRFLILQPGCAQAELRRKEIGGRFETVFDRELRIFTKDILDLADDPEVPEGNIAVRIYDDLLANPFYIRTHNGKPLKAVSSYYLRRATGVAFPHLEWRSGDKTFIAALQSYFDWKWEHAAIPDQAFRDDLLR